MDWLSGGFLALVIALGGLVAYLADGLGRKLGKKRLTLFGLRPRHTATLMTIGAGIAIPLLTVLVLGAASRDFRQWVTEGRAALARNIELSKTISDLDSQIKAKSVQASLLDKKLQTVQAKVTELTTEAKVSKTNADSALIREKSASKRVSSLQGRLGEISGTFRRVSGDLGDARSRLSNLNKTLGLTKQELDASYHQNKLLNDDNASQDKLNKGLKSENSTLEQRRADIQLRLDHASQQISDAEKEVGLIQTELAQKRSELDQATSRLQLAQQLLNENLKSSRTQPMMFMIGEELTRIQLPSQLTPTEALAAARRVQTTASFVADQRGAKALESSGRSAGLYFITVDGKQVSVEEQEQAIAQAISGSRDEVVLIAYSALNSFQGEFVALNIRPYRNKLVYHLGDTIVEGKIDGSQAEATILRALRSLLVEKLKAQASKDGMIPVQGQEATFGTVPEERLLSLMQEISTYGRNVRVLVIAAADTRAADSLRLDFKFR